MPFPTSNRAAGESPAELNYLPLVPLSMEEKLAAEVTLHRGAPGDLYRCTPPGLPVPLLHMANAGGLPDCGACPHQEVRQQTGTCPAAVLVAAVRVSVPQPPPAGR